MASNHYDINREVEINLKLKLNIKTLHNYHPMNDEDKEKAVNEIIEDFKENIIYLLNGNSKFRQSSNYMSFDWATLELE